MKRKPDWADQTASRQRYALKDGVATISLRAIAQALRAANRRGFKRAVKLLREEGARLWMSPMTDAADWLEEQERK